jgi:hypothetical protein
LTGGGDIKKLFNKKYMILSVSAAVSGVLNGFVGTGAGIILYFVLKSLNKSEDNKTEIKDIMAMIICAVIPMSIVSSIVYMTKGDMIYKELATYLPAALIGGMIGAFALDKLKFKIVRKLFAAMIIYAGIRMIF